MQFGLTADKKRKPTDEDDDAPDAAPDSVSSKPKCKAKAKAKGKAKAKAKAKGSKGQASASTAPEEPEEPEEAKVSEELPKRKSTAPRGSKVTRSKSRRLLLRERENGSVSKASKKASKKIKGKRGHTTEEEEPNMEDATQHYDENEQDSGDEARHEEAWSWPEAGIIAGPVDRKRKREDTASRRVRGKVRRAAELNRPKAGEEEQEEEQGEEQEEDQEAEQEAEQEEEEEEDQEAEQEEGAQDGRKTFARRPCPSSRPLNIARFEAIRDAYQTRIHCFVVGHSKLEDHFVG